MDTDQTWLQLMELAFADLENRARFPDVTPQLAHYTSIDVLESIIKNDEVWFSNPLYMNDVEELRFGIVNGVAVIRQSDALQSALVTPDRFSKFISSLDYYVSDFEERYLIDTFVFCLSLHQPDDADGRLSMWRGYGAGGQGAAIVLDTSKLEVNDDSPMIIAEVEYGTAKERLDWVGAFTIRMASKIAEFNLPDDQLYLAAGAIFERLKLFSLFSKHRGFEEEQEWRVVYLSERDTADVYRHMIGHHIGEQGIEPKLRMKIAPIDGFTFNDFSLTKIVSGILLGPSISAPLARNSVSKMLEALGKPELVSVLKSSSIPYRNRR